MSLSTMEEHCEDDVIFFAENDPVLQVEYAEEMSRMAPLAVALCARHCIVIGVEKKTESHLQNRMPQKISMLDDNIAITFSGLIEDAKVIISRAQAECLSQKQKGECPVSTLSISRYIAELKQTYVQCVEPAPLSLSCLICGFDEDGESRIYQTDPSGNYFEYAACAIGRGSQIAGDILQQASPALMTDEPSAIQWALRLLMSAAHLSGDNIDVAVLKYKEPLRILDKESLAPKIVAAQQEIEEETKAKQHLFI